MDCLHTRRPIPRHHRSDVALVRLLRTCGVLMLILAASAGDPSRGIRAAAASAGPTGEPQTQPAALIEAAVRAAAAAPEGRHRHPEALELAALYGPGAYHPVWVDMAGRPTRAVADALDVLATASGDGLDPEAYRVTHLRRLAGQLDGRSAGSRRTAADVATFEVAMSAAVLRYFRHVHLGRVDPQTMGFRLIVPAEPHDFAALLHSALSTHRIRETAADLAPPLAQYRALKGALERYRELATTAGLDPLPFAAATVRPGEPYAELGALHQRLVALGDLPETLPRPEAGAPYDGPVVDGVMRLQGRHGLSADGVIGKATQAALHVPLTWRLRQIELALERLRWLPDLGDEPLIALNIPMFHLWAWSATPRTAPSIEMRAIVGRALSTETPVMVEDLRYLVFRPYWNVPRSILRNEILPILARDLDYLRRQDMEIVRGWDDGAVPVAATAENVALLRGGALRLRQRPGPRNALGLVKFVFPNDAAVYMHGTPAQELFSRTRRDFSHGCVRLEDPVALAEWLLRDQPAWSREQILAAMSGSAPRRVNLTRPVRVVLYYVTASVSPDGVVHFAEDIYRHDARLDRALAAVEGLTDVEER
jgi:L,D-transpeptidase YcbB